MYKNSIVPVTYFYDSPRVCACCCRKKEGGGKGRSDPSNFGILEKEDFEREQSSSIVSMIRKGCQKRLLLDVPDRHTYSCGNL